MYASFVRSALPISVGRSGRDTAEGVNAGRWQAERSGPSMLEERRYGDLFEAAHVLGYCGRATLPSGRLPASAEGQNGAKYVGLEVVKAGSSQVPLHALRLGPVLVRRLPRRPGRPFHIL
jgi:hypothetical protein